MKKLKFALKNSLVLLILFSIFIACEQDFTSIDSDIVNEDTATSFNTSSESFEVITYNDVLGPIQTNNLGVNLLGVYDDPNYGRTTANVVTQLTPNTFNPDFGINAVLDSVVITIPYFNRSVGVNEDNTIDFQLDSVFPRNASDTFNPIKLSIYESNYFIRDFDPNSEFNTPQNYFSNQSASSTELISDAELEGTLIDTINELIISDQAIVLTDNDVDNPSITQTLMPQIRLSYKNGSLEDASVISYWQQKILNQDGNAVLSNANNFNNHIRGIYFKTEPLNNNGSLLILDLIQNQANITLHYTTDGISGQREQRTYVLTYGPNRINFFRNEFNIQLSDGDEVNGDSRLFIKGGEGSIAGIKLFNGENTDSDNSIDNTFEAWRKQFVNLNEDGTFQSSKRLVNEANLVFYVDPTMVNGEEPNRLYLYDTENNIPLLDFITDLTNDVMPEVSKQNHLGILEREENQPDGQGIRYKMRITSHINNLLIEDSTNVRLGLSVSGNVNLEETIPQRAQQINNSIINNIPVSSIVSPRGTILHGSNSEDQSRRVFLEIFYTCLNTDDECEENN